MKSEHEKLKEICDVIGYETKHNIEFIGYYEDRELNSFIELENSVEGYRFINVREIIFTQEFMDLYKLYYMNNNTMSIGIIYINIMLNNLDNPVEYLHNTLELGK